MFLKYPSFIHKFLMFIDLSIWIEANGVTLNFMQIYLKTYTYVVQATKIAPCSRFRMGAK